MPKTLSGLEDLTKQLISFRDARDWKRFHSLKNLILSLNLEAAELLELTQWQAEEEFEKAVSDAEVRQNLKDECADVLLYLLLIAERAQIDLLQAAADKIKKNQAKYPVDKARGNARKYTRL
jgi:NTP pyrophosphatase (non-canonical NTP hydrolase)